MGQFSELHGRLLRLKLEARAALTKAGEAEDRRSPPGTLESKTLAEATEDLWRVLDALHGKANFDPNQPRVPAGNSDGGQWTDGTQATPEGGKPRARGTEHKPSGSPQALTSFLDRMNEQGYQWVNNVLLAAGHHLVPVAVVRKLGIPAETAKVLGDTTGPLLPPRHGWNEAHAKYSREAEKVVGDFAKARGKLPSQLTPDDGRALMKEFWHSKNPVIRQFNLNIFRTEITRQVARRGRHR